MCFTPVQHAASRAMMIRAIVQKKSVAVRAILVCMWCCCLHGFSMDPCLIAGVSWNS